MKWLIILGILLIAAAIFATRYRRQIKMGIYVWRMFRQMKQGSRTSEKRIEKKEDAKDIALVRCAKCGTWIPHSKSLNLRSGTKYCSTACLETAAKTA